MSQPPASRSRRRSGLVRQFPEPARFWVAYSPRLWRCAGGPWTDLAAARLRGWPAAGAIGGGLPDLDATDLDDVLYLPPVAAEWRSERDLWATRLLESGTSLLVGLVPGEPATVAAAASVYDLLSPLLAGDLERLSQLPGGATAVWPLITGMTDGQEIQQRGCATLAAAGVRCLQPLSVELAPADRRRLVELGGERAFDALFHGSPPSERELSRCAASFDLEAFVARPAVAGNARQIRNRRLATDLALAGELWLRLGRSISAGQALIRAARGAESTGHDLVALSRESNLGVLDWLDPTSLALIREVAEHDRSSLLDALREEYLA